MTAKFGLRRNPDTKYRASSLTIESQKGEQDLPQRLSVFQAARLLTIQEENSQIAAGSRASENGKKASERMRKKQGKHAIWGRGQRYGGGCVSTLECDAAHKRCKVSDIKKARTVKIAPKRKTKLGEELNFTRKNHTRTNYPSWGPRRVRWRTFRGSNKERL